MSLSACQRQAPVPAPDLPTTPPAAGLTPESGLIITGSTVPDNWPTDAPLYPQAVVLSSGAPEQPGLAQATAVILQSAEPAEVILAYYRAELARLEWDTVGTMETTDSTALSVSKELRSLSVQVKTMNSQSFITLIVSLP